MEGDLSKEGWETIGLIAVMLIIFAPTIISTWRNKDE